MAKDASDEKWQEDATLKLMGGDESVITDILNRWAEPLGRTICKRYSALSNADAEDVVAVAVWRLWRWREQYDGSQGSIKAVLYKIARRIAEDWRCGKSKWQQAKLYEQGTDPEDLSQHLARATGEDDGSEEPSKVPPLHSALAGVFADLPALQREIWQTYADAGGFEVDASALGRELGRKHNNGVPYPGGTIRGYKSRAKETIVREMKKNGFDLKALGYIHD